MMAAIVATEDILASLESRLDRLTHYVTGSDGLQDHVSSTQPSGQASVSARLASLEAKISHLSAKTPVVADLLRLYEMQPDLLEPNSQDDDIISKTDKLGLVLASAPIFHAAQFQMSNLQESFLPDTSSLVPLVSAQQHLARARAVQKSHQSEIAQLRERSTILLAQWYGESVLRGGEQWSEWEQRLMDVERRVRRNEVQRSREVA